jgi:hypothetical protein
MTYFLQSLNRKVDIKESRGMRRVTVREAIAMTMTNRALKGDPKLLPLVLDLDREISTAQEREKTRPIRDPTTVQEALEAYKRTLRGEDP